MPTTEQLDQMASLLYNCTFANLQFVDWKVLILKLVMTAKQNDALEDIVSLLDRLDTHGHNVAMAMQS